MINLLFSTRKRRFRYRFWAKRWPDLNTVVTNFNWLFLAKSPYGKWVIKSVIAINVWIMVNTWHVVWTISMELWEHLFEKRVQMCCGLIIMRLFEVGANSRLGAYSSKYGNRLPRIIAPPCPSCLLLFLLSPPCQVKVERSDPAKLISDNSSWRRKYWHWKLIKEPNLEHLKSSYVVIMFQCDKGHDFQWAIQYLK